MFRKFFIIKNPGFLENLENLENLDIPFRVLPGSELPALDHAAYALDIIVVALGVVVLCETIAKAEGEGLIGVGLERTDKGFGDVVARLIAFAVDEFDEQTALRAAQFLERRPIGGL